MKIDGDAWRVLAIDTLYKDGHQKEQARKRSLKTQERDFREDFGCHWETCSELWYLLEADLPKGTDHKHLLWGLFFAKNYTTESVSKKLVASCPKTLRKWCWIVLQHIADLHGRVVSFLLLFFLQYFLPIFTNFFMILFTDYLGKP